MVSARELVDLERQGWQALSADGDTAAAHYERVLADEVLMLLPGGLVIDDRQAVVESMRGEPWESFELADARVLALASDAVVVAYRATARRSGSTYAALCNSTYRRTDGRWRLALHQQTPL